MKSNSPSTEPRGAPYCTCDRDISSFTATNWWRSDKYDLNHASALPLMPTKCSNLFKRILWSIVLNAALRSSSTNREIQPRSDDTSRSFVTLMRAVSVLWDGVNPDWKSSQTSFFSKKEYNCEDTTFSSIFDRKWRFEIGLKLTRSLGSSCGFLMRGLITANLKVYNELIVYIPEHVSGAERWEFPLPAHVGVRSPAPPLKVGPDHSAQFRSPLIYNFIPLRWNRSTLAQI